MCVFYGKAAYYVLNSSILHDQDVNGRYVNGYYCWYFVMDLSVSLIIAMEGLMVVKLG